MATDRPGLSEKGPLEPGNRAVALIDLQPRMHFGLWISGENLQPFLA